jgi:hypothetical protein
MWVVAVTGKMIGRTVWVAADAQAGPATATAATTVPARHEDRAFDIIHGFPGAAPSDPCYLGIPGKVSFVA